VTSGTLTGGTYTVPANARSVTLIIHSSGGISVTGEVTGSFTWAGSDRTWNAIEGTSFSNSFNFTAGASGTKWEVNYTI